MNRMTEKQDNETFRTLVGVLADEWGIRKITADDLGNSSAMKTHADDLEKFLISSFRSYYNKKTPAAFFDAYTGFLVAHIRTMQLESLTKVMRHEDEHMWSLLDSARLKDKRDEVADNEKAIAIMEAVIKALGGDAS